VGVTVGGLLRFSGRNAVLAEDLIPGGGTYGDLFAVWTIDKFPAKNGDEGGGPIADVVGELVEDATP
jgi:hypothetical protein